jgi:hypothetical protein
MRHWPSPYGNAGGMPRHQPCCMHWPDGPIVRRHGMCPGSKFNVGWPVGGGPKVPYLVSAQGGPCGCEDEGKAAFFAKKPWICTVLSLQSKAVVVDIDPSPTTNYSRFALAPVAISPITLTWFRSNKACVRGRMVRWVGSGAKSPWTCWWVRIIEI